jgi:hypothetical protein
MGKAGKPLPEHGSINRYKGYGCRCGRCRTANTERMMEYMAFYASRCGVGPNGRAYSPDAKRHGTLTSFGYYGCRCDPCREAKAESDHRKIENRRQRKAIIDAILGEAQAVASPAPG